MSNQSSLQGSPCLFQNGSLNNSLDNSAVSIRSFYSNPNQTASPVKKKFIIKSKAPSSNTSNFNQKIHSSTNLSEIVDMKAIVLPGKQNVIYRKKPSNNLDYNRNKPTKISSMQNIPLNTSISTSLSPPKRNNLARLKPLNKHFEVKSKKNQQLLENLLQNIENDEVEEEKHAKEMDISISVEEKKEEDEASPMIVVQKNLLPLLTSTDTLNLINHNLKDETLEHFLSKIDPQTKKFYLTNNSFGANSLKKFIEFARFDNKITELELEEAQITDQIASELFINILKFKHLKILNLTSNFISHQSSVELKSLLANNTSLKELYLRRNKLTGVAGTNIFQGLLLNNTLKVLDLSWNIIGMKSCSDGLNKLLKQESCGLVHIDLSYNNFTMKECQMIKEGISSNHNLYGLHFEGNYGYMDAKGFLIIPENFRKKPFADYNTARRIKGLKSYHQKTANNAKIVQNPMEESSISNYSNNSEMKVFTNNTGFTVTSQNPNGIDDEDPIPFKDCCWLCENWHEAVFELSLDELVDLPPITRAFIHLDIDGFQGNVMIKPNPKASKYLFRKVLPATRVTFFFTVNELQLTSERFFTMKNPTPVLQEIRIGEMVIPELEMPELNYIEEKCGNNCGNNANIDNISYHPGFFEEIRLHQNANNEINPQVLGGKVPNIHFSIPNELLIEDIKPELYPAVVQSFTMDYSNTRINNFASSEAEEKSLKSLILRYFPQIKEIYHYLSALSPMANVFCITQAVFLEFARNCNLIDDKYMKISDIDVVFFTTFTPLSKLQSDSAKSNKYLIRCQFLEALVRIATEKYIKSLKTDSITEALEKLLLENILPAFRNIENSHWKVTRFLTEKVEVVIKKHWNILEFVFKQNYNKKPQGLSLQNPPGLLWFSDFQALILAADLVNKNFTEKDVNIAFRLSVSFHEEDLNIELNRNLMLNFNEFIEAVARCAEKSCIVPVGDRDADPKWTLKIRMGLPLHVKIEGILMVFLKKLCNEKFIKCYQYNLDKSEYKDDINQVFLAHMRASVMEIDKDLTGKGKKNETKTFMRNNLQKAINIAILMNKVTRNLMKHDVRQSIDTPYH